MGRGRCLSGRLGMNGESSRLCVPFTHSCGLTLASSCCSWVQTSVSAGSSCAEVESTKSVSDIYAPVGGTIVDVNSSLDDAPEQLNADPYGAGWIFVVEMSDPGDLDALLDAVGYRALVEG